MDNNRYVSIFIDTFPITNTEPAPNSALSNLQRCHSHFAFFHIPPGDPVGFRVWYIVLYIIIDYH